MNLTYAILAAFTILLGMGIKGGEQAFFLLFAYLLLFLLAQGSRAALVYTGSDGFAASRLFKFKFLGNRQALVGSLFRLLVLLLAFWVVFQLCFYAYNGAVALAYAFTAGSLAFKERALYALVALVTGFVSLFATKLLLSEREKNPLNLPLVPWFRLGIYFAALNLILFFGGYASVYLSGAALFYAQLVVRALFWCGFGLLGLLSLELSIGFLKELSKFYVCKSEQAEKPRGVPLFVALFASKSRVLESILYVIFESFNIDLSKSEIASYFFKIFEPSLVGALLLLWLITSVVIVPVDKEAIIKTFGVVKSGHVSKPGLHFKLPYPFARTEFYSPKALRTMNIGFVADENRRSLIWSEQHSLSNENLIVGDGVEFINIDCQVIWRINDLYKYCIGSQNPEELIEAGAYKLLTMATVSSTFDEIISKDRATLANKLLVQLQALVDEAGVGVEIVDLIFLAIHPPLEVADAYEDVISAQIEKLTYVLKAQTEREHKYRFYQADGNAVKQRAEMARIAAIQQATGEAYSIKTKAVAFNEEPALERFRLRLEYMQRLLSAKKLYVYDKGLMRLQDGILLNLTD
jgi:regulator of protease activity HflC (stomatin/prohibitin superfamily)